MSAKHRGDPQSRTADGDPKPPRIGDELSVDELTGKAPPPAPQATPHRAPAKRCGGCRRDLAITDTFCPTCVPNGATVAKFGGANPPDPESTLTAAMMLPTRR